MSTEPAIEHRKKGGGLGWLFAPFLFVAAALGVWTWWWFQVAHQVEQGVDKGAADLRGAGYTVSWKERSVSGWPFRTFVRFRQARVVDPSGHALYAPRFEAEANAYDPSHWIAAAPQGVTFVRGTKGAVLITGQGLRASLSHPNQSPPVIVIELRKPVFTPAAGAEPFPLASADLVALNLKPQPGVRGTGLFLFRIEGGRPRPDGMLDWIGDGEPFSTRWEGAVTHFDSFSGAGWPAAARNWSRAGGAITELRGRAETGSASAQADAASLTAGPDGRLRGSLDLSVTGGPQSLLAMARARAVDPSAAAAAAAATGIAGGLNGSARVRLDFTPEGARIGPARLSDSPRVY
jgi:hypothetical protein